MIDVGALLDGSRPRPRSTRWKRSPPPSARWSRRKAVSFLIADFSGRALVRLTSAGTVDGARSHGVEQAETLPLRGTVYERVMRTQHADVATSTTAPG